MPVYFAHPSTDEIVVTGRTFEDILELLQLSIDDPPPHPTTYAMPYEPGDLSLEGPIEVPELIEDTGVRRAPQLQQVDDARQSSPRVASRQNQPQPPPRRRPRPTTGGLRLQSAAPPQSPSQLRVQVSRSPSRTRQPRSEGLISQSPIPSQSPPQPRVRATTGGLRLSTTTQPLADEESDTGASRAQAPPSVTSRPRRRFPY